MTALHSPLHEKTIKKTRRQPREEPIIFYWPDGGEDHVTDPDQVKFFRARAKEYNRAHGTRLSAAHAVIRAVVDMWEHPVKSLKFDWLKRQDPDQLGPSDLLPVPVQFNNTRLD